MELLVRYQPTGENWKQFELEKGVMITKQRNIPATCKVSLPRVLATERMSGYGNLQVLMNNNYLFDGKSQLKPYRTENVELTAYDYLWDLSKERRMFEQGTTSMTPSEAFTEAFDKDSNFGNYNAIWGESYSGPWLDNYDATTFVVPAQTAAYFGWPFFDCNNKNGLDFMKLLADLCYRGNKYRYFYWFENINGTWYIFFQPNGWGKTWKNLSYTIVDDLNESYEDIFNNIIVWGRKTGNYWPMDQDNWTEKNIDGWNLTSQFMSTCTHDFDNSNTQYGEHSYHLDITLTTGGIPRAWSYRTFNDGQYDYMSLDHIKEFRFKWKFVGTAADFYEGRVYLLDSASKGAYVFLTNPVSGTWYDVVIDGKTKPDSGPDPTKWYVIDSGFNWFEIDKLYMRWEFDTGLTSSHDIYIDHMYFDLHPIKSQNISNATGYDATSAGLYQKRTPAPINMPWVNRVEYCNSFASSLVNYYKDPQYTLSMKFNEFKPFYLNDNINFTRYGKNLTLPIDKLSWNFKEEGEIETTVNLGLPRLELGDLLSKFSVDVVEPSKQWGLEYYIF